MCTGYTSQLLPPPPLPFLGTYIISSGEGGNSEKIKQINVIPKVSLWRHATSHVLRDRRNNTEGKNRRQPFFRRGEYVTTFSVCGFYAVGEIDFKAYVVCCL